MVLDLLGQSLQQLIDEYKSFSLKTTLMLLAQMLNNIEYIHYKGYVFRDVRPKSFALGLGSNCTKLYTSSLRLAQRYVPAD